MPRVIGFKKNFCCRPRVCKVFFFFCCALLGAATFRRGRAKKKKHHPGCFFFAPAPGKGRGRRSPVPARGFSFPCLSPGRSKKKNTLGGVFFFAAAPRGRSLTHCGPGWRCLPLAGVVFVFFAAGRGRTGVVFFFFAVAPARTLTHSLWAGAISARPGWYFFFAAAPPGLFRQ